MQGTSQHKSPYLIEHQVPPQAVNACLELPTTRQACFSLGSSPLSPIVILIHHSSPQRRRYLLAVRSSILTRRLPTRPSSQFFLTDDPLSQPYHPGLHHGSHPKTATMDTLVAQYSRPAFQRNEPFSDQDELDAIDSVPSLSLKFAMPPVAHVS